MHGKRLSDAGTGVGGMGLGTLLVLTESETELFIQQVFPELTQYARPYLITGDVVNAALTRRGIAC